MYQFATIETCQPVAERFRRNGTWWVPTIANAGASRLGRTAYRMSERAHRAASEFWSGTPFVSRTWADSLRTPPDSHGYMSIPQRVGMPIMLGTDAGAYHMTVYPPGFSVHVELMALVVEGLTPLGALQTATINPAKFLRGTDSLGTVAAGKLADLVLLDANPLADIMNVTAVRAVVANGRYYDRAALDRLLAEIQTKAQSEPKPIGRQRR
jgi:imidazolonepropionase-like amidohydrolase